MRGFEEKEAGLSILGVALCDVNLGTKGCLTAGIEVLSDVFSGVERVGKGWLEPVYMVVCYESSRRRFRVVSRKSSKRFVAKVQVGDDVELVERRGRGGKAR